MSHRIDPAAVLGQSFEHIIASAHNSKEDKQLIAVVTIDTPVSSVHFRVVSHGKTVETTYLRAAIDVYNNLA